MGLSENLYLQNPMFYESLKGIFLLLIYILIRVRKRPSIKLKIVGLDNVANSTVKECITIAETGLFRHFRNSIFIRTDNCLLKDLIQHRY